MGKIATCIQDILRIQFKLIASLMKNKSLWISMTVKKITSKESLTNNEIN